MNEIKKVGSVLFACLCFLSAHAEESSDELLYAVLSMGYAQNLIPETSVLDVVNLDVDSDDWQSIAAVLRKNHGEMMASTLELYSQHGACQPQAWDSNSAGLARRIDVGMQNIYRNEYRAAKRELTEAQLGSVELWLEEWRYSLTYTWLSEYENPQVIVDSPICRAVNEANNGRG